MDDRREIDQRPFHPDRCRQLTRLRRIFESHGYTLSVFAEWGAVGDGSGPLDCPLNIAALLRAFQLASSEPGRLGGEAGSLANRQRMRRLAAVFRNERRDQVRFRLAAQRAQR